MQNELINILTHLDYWDYQATEAKKNADGSWTLTICKAEKEEAKNENN